MRKTPSPSLFTPRRTAGRTHGRPGRRGSILILVVAVLVLLALMGTAYMSTARLDRLASGPLNAATSDEVLEQLVPAVSAMVRKVIAEDVYKPAFGYRGPNDPSYDNFDYAANSWSGAANALALKNDSFLGTRLPILVPVGNLAPKTEIYVWTSLSRAVNQPDFTTGTPTMIRFESPYAENLTPGQRIHYLEQYPEYTQDQNTTSTKKPLFLVPSELTITYPPTYFDAGLQNKTRVFPAFMAYNVRTGEVEANPIAPRPMKFLAADADGDGIADAGLVYLTTVDGVRYYYATRTIDNNSAVNVNTARSMRGDFSGATFTVDRPSMWLYPQSVGLLEMLLDAPSDSLSTTSGEMDQINRFLWNIPAGPIHTSLVPMMDLKDPNGTDDTAPQQRTDFPTFATEGEAAYSQLGRRVGNPGFRVGGPAPATGADQRAYAPFLPALNLDLAYRFGMMNPNAIDPVLNTLDGALNALNAIEPVYRGAPNFASKTPAAALASRFRFFPANESEYWFQYSHNWDNPTGPGGSPRSTFAGFGGGTAPEQPVRSLLTTSNTVSNRTPGLSQAINSSMLPYGHKGRWHDEFKYEPGDICIYTVPGTLPALPKTYVYMATVASGPSTTPPQTGATVAAGWSRLNPRGIWVAGGGYVVGDIVQYNTNTAANGNADPNWSLYVHTGGAGAGVPTAGAPWLAMSAYNSPPRTSLNTAPFEELFRSFFNVMSEGNTGGPPLIFGTDMTGFPAGVGDKNHAGTASESLNDPYIGMRFHPMLPPAGSTSAPMPRPPFDAFRDDEAAAAALPGGVDGVKHPSRMLRSPIRALPNQNAPHFGTFTRRLTAQSVMQLRAAIAAVNAIDARDADANVTSRKLMLHMVQGAGFAQPADFMPVEVTVNGQEPQPFITEVYASTDTATVGPTGFGNPQGYVAIELYNPYPFDIPLNEWRLAAINRQGDSTGTFENTTQDLAVRDLANFSEATYVASQGGVPVVPANGYLVLENFDNTDTGAFVGDLQRAGFRPASSGLPPGLPPTARPAWGRAANTPSSGAAAPDPPEVNFAYLRLPNATAEPQTAGSIPATVFNQEIVLLKRRQFDGLVATNILAGTEPGVAPLNEDAATNPHYLRELVPVDSFDFTGLILPIGGAVDGAGAPVVGAQVWHYMRASNNNPAPGGTPAALKNWHFVYPGRYDATNSLVTAWNPAVRPRQAGTRYSTFYNPTTERDEWDRDDAYTGGLPTSDPVTGAGTRPPLPEMTFGETYGAPTIQVSNASGVASYHTTFPCQLGFGNFHNPATATPGASIGNNPVIGAGPFTSPFGGFTRNADVLHVPFIGSYTIKIADPGYLYPTASGIPTDPGAATLILGGTYVVEMNPVTMDAAMAEDADPADDPTYLVAGAIPGQQLDGDAPLQFFEQLGHFCPDPRPAPIGFASYDWTRDVLDYFTAIQNSSDDFLPNTNPAGYPGATPPRGVPSANGALANTEQDFDAGVDGLVNVNTASWKVLAALPLVVDTGANVVVGTGMPGDPTNLNEQLARAIVYFRDVNDGTGTPHGPFTSLFDLNKVVDTRPGGLGGTNGFRNMMGRLTLTGLGTIVTTNDPGDGHGDFTPFDATSSVPNGVTTGRQEPTDGVRLDYEEKNLNLIRLSNLLTTRSDTFTTYVLVQGWKETGTVTPQLVAERRAAFITDRSKMYSGNAATESRDVPTK